MAPGTGPGTIGRPMSEPANEERSAAGASVRLEGVLEKIVFQDEAAGFAVAQLAVGDQGSVTLRGNLLGARLGETLRVQGDWTRHPQYGRQVRVRAVEVVPPATTEGLRAYLASGLVKGIGPAIAARIVESFGLRTLDVLEQSPELLRKVKGVGVRRAKEIAQVVRDQRGVRELVSFLAQQGVSARAALRIWRHYGPDSLRFVRENPYRLADDVAGFGFRKADEIAEKLGVASESPERARAGLVHVLGQASAQGHTCLPEPVLLDRASELLRIGRPPVEAALEAGVREERLAVVSAPRTAERGPDDPDRFVYLPELRLAEGIVARRIRDLVRARPTPPLADPATIEPFAARARIELHPRQRAAVAAALSERVLVITGGPGVGKTTIVRLVVDLAVARRKQVLLCSPTGRAARRLNEATGKPTSTIHKLLDFNPRTGAFQRNARRPLDADLVVVDEASMIDIVLAARLLQAVRPGTRVVLVGDADQLPSVGPGSFLRDLIASERVPTERLTEVYRQEAGSGIVRGAHRILAGELPHSAAEPTGEGDLFFLPREDPLDALKTILFVVTQRIPRAYGLDPRTDVQVISPMYRGEVGVDRLNREIRDLLNPRGSSLGSGERLFRENDRVMVTRNDAGREIFNGDVGRVVRVDTSQRTLAVDFGGRTLDFDESRLSDLVPAWAISVHRSQGSEYPAVVVPLVTQHFVMLRRTLLYTALTRAKRLCVLVGSRRALGVAVRDARSEDRWSLLKDRLQA